VVLCRCKTRYVALRIGTYIEFVWWRLVGLRICKVCLEKATYWWKSNLYFSPNPSLRVVFKSWRTIWTVHVARSRYMGNLNTTLKAWRKVTRPADWTESDKHPTSIAGSFEQRRSILCRWTFFPIQRLSIWTLPPMLRKTLLMCLSECSLKTVTSASLRKLSCSALFLLSYTKLYTLHCGWYTISNKRTGETIRMLSKLFRFKGRELYEMGFFVMMVFWLGYTTVWAAGDQYLYTSHIGGWRLQLLGILSYLTSLFLLLGCN
jgi:hypothetical protein